MLTVKHSLYHGIMHAQSLAIENGSVPASDVNCVCRPVFPLPYIVAACVRILLSILMYVTR